MASNPTLNTSIHPSLSSASRKPNPLSFHPHLHLSTTPRKPLFAQSSAAPSLSSPTFDLKTYWKSLISEIDVQLDAAVPLRFPSVIHEAMRHTVLSPGAKRASPILCIATCELFGAPRSLALPTACALEMIHAASLIHDDLPCMDDAPARRGRPSNHAAFGMDMAILAGDALFPLAFAHITNAYCADQNHNTTLSYTSVLRLVTEIASTVGARGMVEGQFLDLHSTALGALGGVAGDYFETDIMKGRELVERIVEKKFGVMAECSAVCGAIVGGANEEEMEHLRRYGRAVGVLYQVVDDIKEVRGGKNEEGGEKKRSRASYARAYGVQGAMQLAEGLREQAKRELQGFHGAGVLPLYSFVDYAINRDFEI
ncbi:hypothetical protein AMTRI_Chr09g15100 [Amborella trichopoda]